MLMLLRPEKVLVFVVELPAHVLMHDVCIKLCIFVQGGVGPMSGTRALRKEAVSPPSQLPTIRCSKVVRTGGLKVPWAETRTCLLTTNNVFDVALYPP